MTERICVVENCGKPRKANGYCAMHCSRLWRWGNTDPRPAAPWQPRFWAKVVTGDGCWTWTGASTKGYGVFRLDGQSLYAHRLSWQIVNGPVPAGMHVCHRCDNPPCVRPDHLFLGTADENMADMAAKGRSPRGPRHHNARLDEQAVRFIRGRAAQGERVSTIVAESAATYGVTASAVYAVLRRERWKHI